MCFDRAVRPETDEGLWEALMARGSLSVDYVPTILETRLSLMTALPAWQIMFPGQSSY